MFCRIYFSKMVFDLDELTKVICRLINANLINNSYIEKRGYSIDLRPNDEYDANKERNFPSGFLHFPYSIEIDISDSITNEDAAKEVSVILFFLWKNNYAAVAACDFEHLLPENGGYKSINVPWPK